MREVVYVGIMFLGIGIEGFLCRGVVCVFKDFN